MRMWSGRSMPPLWHEKAAFQPGGVAAMRLVLYPTLSAGTAGRTGVRISLDSMHRGQVSPAQCSHRITRTLHDPSHFPNGARRHPHGRRSGRSRSAAPAGADRPLADRVGQRRGRYRALRGCLVRHGHAGADQSVHERAGPGDAGGRSTSCPGHADPDRSAHFRRGRGHGRDLQPRDRQDLQCPPHDGRASAIAGASLRRHSPVRQDAAMAPRGCRIARRGEHAMIDAAWAQPVLAFAAGLLTVAAPCVLPLLALVFGSVQHLFGLEQQTVRDVAAGLLVVFGLCMVWPGAFQRFTMAASGWLNRISGWGDRAGTGWAGGLLVGVSLGAVSTPCAGPVLGTILSLVAAQTNRAAPVGLLGLYALGAAMPMLAIAYGGQWALSKVRTLTRHTHRLQQVMGLVIAAVGLLTLLQYDTQVTLWLSNFYPSMTG